jgi:hypothetical protein
MCIRLVILGLVLSLGGCGVPHPRAEGPAPYRIEFDNRVRWTEGHEGIDPDLPGYHVTGDIARLILHPAGPPPPNGLVLAITPSSGMRPLLERFQIATADLEIDTTLVEAVPVETVRDRRTGALARPLLAGSTNPLAVVLHLVVVLFSSYCKLKIFSIPITAFYRTIPLASGVEIPLNGRRARRNPHRSGERPSAQPHEVEQFGAAHPSFCPMLGFCSPWRIKGLWAVWPSIQDKMNPFVLCTVQRFNRYWRAGKQRNPPHQVCLLPMRKRLGLHRLHWPKTGSH